MLWFSVWTVLVLGTGVGGFFLLRRLYRSARSLLAELEHAADALAVLGERAEELARAGVGAEPVPVDLLDPGPARERLESARGARLLRRIRRSDRHAEVYRRWEAFTH